MGSTALTLALTLAPALTSRVWVRPAASYRNLTSIVAVRLGYGGGWQDNEAANFSYHGKPTDYATALIGNKSIEWLSRPTITGAESEGRPFFIYFAPHCPHTPAYPADWYRDECQGVGSPRTPAYNYTADGFHELV